MIRRHGFYLLCLFSCFAGHKLHAETTGMPDLSSIFDQTVDLDTMDTLSNSTQTSTSNSTGTLPAEVEAILAKLPAAQQSALRAALAEAGPQGIQQFLAGLGVSDTQSGGMTLTADMDLSKDPTAFYQVCTKVCERDGWNTGCPTFCAEKVNEQFFQPKEPSIDPMMLMMLMGGLGGDDGGDGKKNKLDPQMLMLLMASQNKDGNSGGLDPMLLMQLMQ